MWENIAFIIGFTVQDYGKIRHGLTFKGNDEITGLKPTYNSQEARKKTARQGRHTMPAFLFYKLKKNGIVAYNLSAQNFFEI